MLSDFIIDSRESRSGVPDYIEAYIPQALEKLHWRETVPLIHRKLAWGDYLWGDVRERIFCGERKTYLDLLSSMNENGEKKMLAELGFEVDIKQVHKVTRQLYLPIKAGARTFLFLEGTPWVDDVGKLFGRRHVNSIEAMLMRYELEGVQVILTENPQHTAKKVVDYYLMCQRKSEVWP